MTRAVPIIRQSKTHDGSASPAEQKKRLAELFAREGWQAACEPIEELDVSGKTPLARRKGLLRAVEMVEDGEAEVIAVAYFDRLVRSIRVQLEVTERVEEAGGNIYAADLGQLTNGSAAEQLSVDLLTALNAHYCNSAAERTAEHKAAAISRGVPPFAALPPGLRKVYDGGGKVIGIEPDPETREIIVQAFELRAGIETGQPATLAQVRAFLLEHGIDRRSRGITAMFSNRLYRGELHFGDFKPNLTSHEAIVSEGLFERVRNLSIPRGRLGKSDRLLARLGVLKCDGCKGRMSVGGTTRRGVVYHLYRCTNPECKSRAFISAKVEELVVEKMRERAAKKVGQASVQVDVQVAEAEAEAAHEQLATATRTTLLAGIADQQAAVDALAELRRVAEEKDELVRRLRAQVGGGRLTLKAADLDPDDPEERDDLRALIALYVPEVFVRPGKPGGREPLESRIKFGKPTP